MSIVNGNLDELVAVSEQVGATLERRRIRRVIAELPVGNCIDEQLYRQRVLKAITPTAVRESVDGAALDPPVRPGNPTGSPTAAAGVTRSG